LVRRIRPAFAALKHRGRYPQGAAQLGRVEAPAPVQWRARALEDGGFRVVPTLATSIRRRIHAFAG